MPSRFYPFFVLLFSCVFVNGSVSCADPAMDIGMVPHKALYDIRLTGTQSGSQIINVDGQMFYEWESDCEGWISNHRFDVLYEYADSPAVRIDSNFTTYEQFDGRALNFSSSKKRNGAIFKKVRGHALVNAKKDGVAEYSHPKDLSFDLPEGTLFPITHTMDVIKAIRAREKFYSTTIFDGSDEDGPVEVNAFIGKKNQVKHKKFDKEKVDLALLESHAHNIRLAFFPLHSGEPNADYEMDLVFHENGVISDMLVEYPNFTVRQKLLALEPLEKTCKEE